jgi:ssDNA-binding replication factor A large subunit
MSDFDELVDELLRNRPELTKEEVMRRVKQKKETVGAGYLTDQGALFLVAGELGVSLQRSASSDLPIKELRIGANDVTVLARVLGVYPVSTYQKKDGGTGRYRRLALFDKEASIRLTVWDDQVDEVEKQGVSVGTPMRVVSGYVKAGLDGKPNLSLGKRGRLESLKDGETAHKLPTVDEAAEKLPKLTSERQFPVVECKVSSEPRYSEFVREDGSQGSLFQFEVTNDRGNDRCRVVIWSPSNRPEIKVGQKVVLTNLRSRRSSRGDFELHGDAGSAVIENLKKVTAELRVVTTADAGGGPLVLAVDREKKVRVLEVAPGHGLKGGEVVIISPDSEFDGRLVCKTPGALSRGSEDAFPALTELSTKVKSARDESALIMVEVIALSHPVVEDIRLKDGSTVKKGEVVVGDDTGEISVVGWREHSAKLAGIQPGERLRMVGVTPKSSRMGAWVLQTSALTAIEHVKSRG